MSEESLSPLKIRLTSWEKWGFRTSTEFTAEGLQHLKDGGFNGIFVGGGSGMTVGTGVFVAGGFVG